MAIAQKKHNEIHMTMRIKRILVVLLYRVLPVGFLAIVIPSLQHIQVVASMIAFSLWAAAEAYIEDPKSNKAAISSIQDKWSRPVVLWTHLLAWFAPFAETVVREPSYNNPVVLLFGIVLFTIGSFLRITAVHTLGKDFTAHVMTRKDQKVCRRGPYAYVRHPSYLGLFLINISVAVMMGAPVSFALAFIGSLLGIGLRVRIEEEVLSRELGASYGVYCQETPRWFPAIPVKRQRTH